MIGVPRFDAVFIFGTLVVALVFGAVASISPGLLMAAVLVDIWLFANPHVVATYTRIGAGMADIKRHWFLIFFLPMIVCAGVVATALSYEVAGLFTLYFLAQTYHVTRQSFGIARAYRRIRLGPFYPDRLAEALVYLVPVWGLLSRCAGAPTAFLGYPIQLPFVPQLVADIAGFVTIVCGVWWLQRQCRAALAGEGNWQHDAFVLSHVCVSLVAYIWIADITVGWLVVNVWHNLQYLLFVWVQNTRRDRQTKGSLLPADDFVTVWKSAIKYGGLCLLFGAALYQAIDWMGMQLLWLGLPTVLIAHFTVNFHHYLVDGVIWKQRRSVQFRRS
ncbi:hypothetical protein [Ottowia thiooxydans]|uniref:hypothetical protein n=1 Tax=Ottowia thiooxydans TaxID=219182 RepID=UPI0003F4FEC3|nr:hypothetical protein [Ottowia thiooxydans]